MVFGREGEWGSVGISGFLFHHETLAQEILIVDPCGQDLEILPQPKLFGPGVFLELVVAPSNLGALSKFVPSVRQRDAGWVRGLTAC